VVTKPVLVLRLLPDDSALQLLVPRQSPGLSVRDLYAQLCVECDRIGLAGPPPFMSVVSALETATPGEWLSVLAGFPPTPPTNGSLEMLVDVPVAATGDAYRLHRMAVKAGTPLVRRRPGRAGRPGNDLRLGPIPPSLPREPQMPAGQNTRIGADHVTLLATCDGEAVFRHLRIDVFPSRIIDGDLGRNAKIESTTLPIFITGSVARVRALRPMTTFM